MPHNVLRVYHYKSHCNAVAFVVVHPKRLELPTFWSVARRSIQLRYECMIFNYGYKCAKRFDTFVLYSIASDLSSVIRANFDFMRYFSFRMKC